MDNAWSESSDNDDTKIHKMEGVQGEELDKNLQALKAAIENLLTLGTLHVSMDGRLSGRPGNF